MKYFGFFCARCRDGRQHVLRLLFDFLHERVGDYHLNNERC